MKRFYQITIGMLAALVLPGYAVKAQENNPLQLMDKIRDANTSAAISYEYKVYKRVEGSRKAIDSMNGKLYKYDKDYLDSNGAYIAAVLSGTYCKLNFRERNAILFDVATFKKQMHMATPDPSSSSIALPDSVISKYGKIAVQNGPHDSYILTITLGAPYHSNLTVEADKHNMLIRSVKMISRVYDGEEHYEQEYDMKNFSRTIDKKIFDPNRFFIKNADKKTVLTGKYTGYKLNTLTK